MTFVTFKENNASGFRHNYTFLNSIIQNNSHLKYIHSPFNYKSKYYDIIFHYDKLFQNYDFTLLTRKKERSTR